MNRFFRTPYLVAAAGATYVALAVTGAGRASADPSDTCMLDALGNVVRVPSDCTPPAGAKTATQHPLQDVLDSWDRPAAKPEQSPFEQFIAPLDHWYAWIAVLFILAGIGMLFRKLDRDEALDLTGRSDTGPAAGINAARLTKNRAAGVVLAALGAVGYSLSGWSISATILVAVPAGIAAAIAVKIYQSAEAREKGFQAKEREYQQALAEAQHAAANAPTVYDPLHPDVVISRPQPVHVPEPTVTGRDAYVHAVSGGIQRPAGSAAEALVTELGAFTPATAAWSTACESIGHGQHAVDSKGRATFVPAATLIGVNVSPNGDEQLNVEPSTVDFGDRQLAQLTAPFLAAAHIRRAVGEWTRDHLAGTWTLTVTNTREEPQAQTAQPDEDVWS